MDDCQFVCITQSDYYKILNDGETNQRKVEEDGKVVLVSEFDTASKAGYKVIRGSPEKLMAQLIEENASVDPTFVEDFLLTHRYDFQPRSSFTQPHPVIAPWRAG